jgi:hypothetical protein
MSYDTIQLRVDEPTAWMLRRHARKRGCSEEEVLYSALNEAFEIPVSRRSIPPRRAAWHDMTRPMGSMTILIQGPVSMRIHDFAERWHSNPRLVIHAGLRRVFDPELSLLDL